MLGIQHHVPFSSDTCFCLALNLSYAGGVQGLRLTAHIKAVLLPISQKGRSDHVEGFDQSADSKACEVPLTSGWPGRISSTPETTPVVQS
jgi:hypothetical protein